MWRVWQLSSTHSTPCSNLYPLRDCSAFQYTLISILQRRPCKPDHEYSTREALRSTRVRSYADALQTAETTPIPHESSSGALSPGIHLYYCSLATCGHNPCDSDSGFVASGAATNDTALSSVVSALRRVRNCRKHLLPCHLGYYRLQYWRLVLIR